MKIYIYALKHPVTKEIRYIGKTENPSRRLYDHCRTHLRGRSHKKSWIISLQRQNLVPELSIVEECTEHNWKDREVFWIAHFKALKNNLTNETEGGDGTLITDEIRRKISEGLKGKPSGMKGKHCTELHKTHLRESQPHARKVCQFDKNGTLIKEWHNMVQAARVLNLQDCLIRKVCKKKRPSHGGFGWCYFEDKPFYQFPKRKNRALKSLLKSKISE